jgi:Flp pilus assembly protein TadG
VGFAHRRSRRRTGKQAPNGRGQALVEFALVVPIMVLIFAGLTQLAFIYERQIGIENAVRDGARRAATYKTNSVLGNACANGAKVWDMVFGSGGTMQSNVEGYDTTGTAVKDPLVTYTNATSSSGLGEVLVKVSVTYKHPLFLPLITQILDGFDPNPSGNDLWISTSSQFTVENDNKEATSWSVSPNPTVYPGC